MPNSNQCGYDKPNRLLHYQPNSPVKITEHDEKRIVRNRDAYCQHDCYQTIAFHEKPGLAESSVPLSTAVWSTNCWGILKSWTLASGFYRDGH